MNATPAAQPLAPSPRRGPLRRLGAWYLRHVWSATFVLILLVVAAGFVALQIGLRGHVGDGVSVAGVRLQGKDRAAARAAIARDVTPRISTVSLQTGASVPLTLSLAQLGLSVDVRATAAAAYANGRHRLPLGLSVWLPGSGGEVAPVLHVDTAAYQKDLDVVRKAVDMPPRDATLSFASGSVAVVPAHDGSQTDAAGLLSAISRSVAAGKAYAGPVPMTPVPPQVSTADAQSRAGEAAAYLARPIALRYRSRNVILTPQQIAGILAVNKGSDAAAYPLTFRNDRARAFLHKLFASAETKPVNARILVKPQGGIKVVPGRDGEVLDMDAITGELDDAASGTGLTTVNIAFKPASPALTTAEARDMGMSALGQQFTTFFDPRNTTRVNNIARAAKLVDGSVVAAGATFSLNAAIGPRTLNRGFDYAPVIASDKVLRQGVGGGICQYATTLFNAVFFAGLPVVERKAHLLYISHYPIGRDATVAWGSADFRFKNDTDHSVTIRSWVNGDSLTVALVGKTGRKVTSTTSPFYDLHKPAHGKSDPRVIYDSDLGPGVVRWEKGTDGCSVKVVRTVRNADGSLRFQDTFVSHYEPLDWVKRIGT